MPAAATKADLFGSNVVIVALDSAELNDGYNGGDGNEAAKVCVVNNARAALAVKTDRNIECSVVTESPEALARTVLQKCEFFTKH
jgi:hypothetical protein